MAVDAYFLEYNSPTEFSLGKFRIQCGIMVDDAHFLE